MLYRDLLLRVFNYLINAKNARLVCSEWNNLLKSRFVIFTANDYLNTVPAHCDILICDGRQIPTLHPNIKKALLMNTGEWNQDIDSLFEFTNRYKYKWVETKSISGNIRNLSIGVLVDKINVATIFKDVTIESLIRGTYFYMTTYDSLILTSSRVLERGRGSRVVYIDPESKIDRLLIGASKLYLVDLNATIGLIHLVNNNLTKTRVIVIKGGNRKEYNIRCGEMNPDIWK